MPRLQSKNFATPDGVDTMPKVRFETVGLDDGTVGHCSFEPGWRWSTDMGPMLGTRSCQMRHLGYTISGAMRIVMDDGETVDIGPNGIFEVPPGHDKWVLGDEPWVCIEWGGALARNVPRLVRRVSGLWRRSCSRTSSTRPPPLNE